MQGCANLKSLCSDRTKMQIQNKEGNKNCQKSKIINLTEKTFLSCKETHIIYILDSSCCPLVYYCPKTVKPDLCEINEP